MTINLKTYIKQIPSKSQLTKIDSGREKHLISTDHQENLISYQ